MIKNLRTGNRKKADELTGFVIEHMKNSPDTLQQLLVYGNTGSYCCCRHFLPISGIPLCRLKCEKTAVFALRLIDHSEVTTLLGNLALNKDTVLSKAANGNYFIPE